MHNCKATRKLLIEQALDQPLSDRSQSLLAELEHCSGCREEFASLRSVLRVADQAMESGLPAERFWSGYHARLRQSLERDSASSAPSLASRARSETGALILLRNLLQKLATGSVPVPVPVAAVLIVLFGLSILFATHSRRQSIVEPLSGTSSVVTRTVEVPVIQEKVVTRVVYRERSPRTIRDDTGTQSEKPARTASNAQRNEIPGNAPFSLVGFKPPNEVKLTIIKGSYRDEK